MEVNDGNIDYDAAIAEISGWGTGQGPDGYREVNGKVSKSESKW